jgi:hypothetical protein
MTADLFNTALAEFFAPWVQQLAMKVETSD